MHRTVLLQPLPRTVHFRNLNRLGRRRTRLLRGRRRRRESATTAIFEVGEINAIRSRAFVDRLAWRRARSFEARGSAARRRRRFSSRSLPRGPSGKAANKRDLSSTPVGALSFSSGPEAHAVAWLHLIKPATRRRNYLI